MGLCVERSYPTPLSNSTLLPLLLFTLAKQKHTPHSSKEILGEYDYIVVGGGSAGSIVASRLSEKPCVSVLLLEAGHEPPLLTEVPAFAGFFLGTDVDWKFKTVPQKHGAFWQKNREILLATGKMLGGSGNHNLMVYIRGNHKNYDEWAAQGAKGWSYKDVLPYFLKMEGFRNSTYNTEYHSSKGPVTVEYPRYRTKVGKAIYKAVKELDYRFIDSNAERQTGFFDYYMNIRHGQRCSSVKAYLVPAAKRRNLHILLNAMVTKVLIENKRARGVEFYYDGQFHVVKARREVIVSAGTINTAKILMLSGIGPRNELQKLNIPVIEDLPVGKNYHEHVRTQITFTVKPRFPSFEEKLAYPSNVLKYVKTKSGPLVQTGDAYAAFLNGLRIAPKEDFPNLILFIGETYRAIGISGNIKPEVYKQFYGPYENETVFQCLTGISQPKSRGSVTLNSCNPFDSPLIDPNILADPTDLEDLVDGMKICLRLLNTVSLQRLGARPLETPAPGCERFYPFSDDYLRCYVRASVTSFHHNVGTCRMGDPKESTTVVDPKLRVKNIRGLRVVDASVMPIVPSGNTNVPTMMVAEKASDIIKKTITCK